MYVAKFTKIISDKSTAKAILKGLEGACKVYALLASQQTNICGYESILKYRG